MHIPNSTTFHPKFIFTFSFHFIVVIYFNAITKWASFSVTFIHIKYLFVFFLLSLLCHAKYLLYLSYCQQYVINLIMLAVSGINVRMDNYIRVHCSHIEQITSITEIFYCFLYLYDTHRFFTYV